MSTTAPVAPVAIYQATESAAALFRGHQAAVFDLVMPTSHKLSFGVPFEIQTYPKDVCEATMEVRIARLPSSPSPKERTRNSS